MMGAGWEKGTGNNPAAPGALLLMPVDTSLFERPLDHLAAENARLLRVCAQLEIIALNASRLAQHSIPVLVPYLRWDYPAHLDWLERSFLPLLEAACFVGDTVSEPIAQLSLEHGQDRSKAVRLAGLLADYGQGSSEGLETKVKLASETFADTQKRHVAWLEMTVFPLAQERLTAEQLKELVRSLEEHYKR
ncbi:hemerythrin domain-containing protein [Fodinicurvata sediminis]|uniref:hemerythrin domain-containing protein n=1 Tax=Fodinicurvata sediminis TaxID=1121832 RepID=UPI0003B70E0C|nr:hemerythrin domain-containing protein [Fodinicurvata sediminis]